MKASKMHNVVLCCIVSGIEDADFIVDAVCKALQEEFDLNQQQKHSVHEQIERLMLDRAAYKRRVQYGMDFPIMDFPIMGMKISDSDIQELHKQLIAAERYKTWLNTIYPYIKKSTGKPQNTSGKPQNVGYAETVGKPQNKWDDLSDDNRRKMLVDKFIDVLLLSKGRKSRCQDKTIVAVLRSNGRVFFGINGISENMTYCPRNVMEMGVNQGYSMCRSICRQESHAEVDTIDTWLRNSTANDTAEISIYGTGKICDNCMALLQKFNVSIRNVVPDIYALIGELLQ